MASTLRTYPFQIKIASPEDWRRRFGKERKIEESAHLFDEIPVLVGRPDPASRPRKCAGFIIAGTANHYEPGQNPAGPGIYALAAISANRSQEFRALIDQPGGLEYTVAPDGKSILSVDIVLENPTGKVLQEIGYPK